MVSSQKRNRDNRVTLRRNGSSYWGGLHIPVCIPYNGSHHDMYFQCETGYENTCRFLACKPQVSRSPSHPPKNHNPFRLYLVLRMLRDMYTSSQTLRKIMNGLRLELRPLETNPLVTVGRHIMFGSEFCIQREFFEALRVEESTRFEEDNETHSLTSSNTSLIGYSHSRIRVCHCIQTASEITDHLLALGNISYGAQREVVCPLEP
jgi:hypothetical protein